VSENKKYSEYNRDVLKNSERIINKLNEKKASDDLKESFKDAVGQASNVIKQIIENIEENITDEEIKTNTKKIIQDIVNEFENNIVNASKKFSEALNLTYKEEE